MADDGIGHHHNQDDDGVYPVPEQPRDERGTQQYIDQDIVELQQEADEGRGATRLGQAIRPEGGQPLLCLGSAQAGSGGVGSQQRVLRRERMPLVRLTFLRQGCFANFCTRRLMTSAIQALPAASSVSAWASPNWPLPVPGLPMEPSTLPSESTRASSPSKPVVM